MEVIAIALYLWKYIFRNHVAHFVSENLTLNTNHQNSCPSQKIFNFRTECDHNTNSTFKGELSSNRWKPWLLQFYTPFVYVCDAVVYTMKSRDKIQNRRFCWSSVRDMPFRSQKYSFVQMKYLPFTSYQKRDQNSIRYFFINDVFEIAIFLERESSWKFHLSYIIHCSDAIWNE